MTFRLGVAVLSGVAAAGALQALMPLTADHVREGLVFGVTSVISAWGAWASLRKARANTGRLARGWRAGAISGVLIAIAQVGAGILMSLDLTNGLVLLPLLGAIATSVLQLGLLARPNRHPLAKFTRLLDCVAVASALAALGWLWVVVPALPIAPQLVPIAFGIAVLPYLLAAAWGLVLTANTPARLNGYAVHLLGASAALRALSAGLALHNQYSQQPIHHGGAAAVILLPAILTLLATTQDVPEPEDSVRRAVSLFWMSVPYLPVVLSVIAIAGLTIVRGDISRLLLWTMLGIVALAVGRQFISLVVIRRLMTELNAQRDSLHRMAHRDTLTGLNNRASFQERAPALLAAAQPDDMTAVMLLDLDGFKAVNDTHGHAAGDHVLIAVGDRLKEVVRPSDAVSRLGGDEFVVLLANIGDVSHIEKIAARIIERLGQPMPYNDTTLRVGASIGIALVAGASDELDTVLHYADNALYAAKKAGKNTFRRHILEAPASAPSAGRREHALDLPAPGAQGGTH